MDQEQEQRLDGGGGYLPAQPTGPARQIEEEQTGQEHTNGGEMTALEGNTPGLDSGLRPDQVQGAGPRVLDERLGRRSGVSDDDHSPTPPITDEVIEALRTATPLAMRLFEIADRAHEIDAEDEEHARRQCTDDERETLRRKGELEFDSLCAERDGLISELLRLGVSVDLDSRSIGIPRSSHGPVS